MIRQIPVADGFGLDDYSGIAQLAAAVRDLETEASTVVPRLRDTTVWMVNSTARGGGVAEMLPTMVKLLRELGIRTEWVTIGSERPEFFAFTKRLHNMIHGDGDRPIGRSDRELYERVNGENAEQFVRLLRSGDMVVVHDPQPLALGWHLKNAPPGVRAIWRCHIGHDAHTPASRAAWDFLRPYAEVYDHAVFSAPEYIPDYLAGRATIIHPAIDPESHKNRPLEPHKLVGVLCNAGLAVERHPILTPPFPHLAGRLRPDGGFAPPLAEDEIGLLYRPIVTQVSRWDRLKGFGPLMRGFVALKRRLDDEAWQGTPRHRQRLRILRLVLAGPDPESIQDDPEASEVLRELCRQYRELPAAVQRDVAVLSLPMASRKENALMVNALQRCSTVVVQNSLREGFGLSATEAMWKRVPIIGTRACGLRQQIREHIDGLLVQNPEDPEEIASKLDDMLADVPRRYRLALNAERRVHGEFLIFSQLGKWLRLLAAVARRNA